MNADVTRSGEHRPDFDGKWPDWLVLQLGNWLLTLITLGIYRFWARTRDRRYLWGQTGFGGEPLEYTGLGRELLVGAILAFFVLILPAVLASGAAAVAKGMGLDALALGINLALYAVVLWLVQFATWRAMRYRLSRTRWCGIGCAMTGSAAAYALLAVRMLALQVITLGFAAPYAAVRLFNARWSDARLGSMVFVAQAEWRPLLGRFLMLWAAVAAIFGGLTAAGAWQLLQAVVQRLQPAAPAGLVPDMNMVTVGLLLVAAVPVLFLAFVRYHAAQWQALVGGLALDGLHFRFTASAGDWLRYWLGNGLLVLFTLGIGAVMLPWRRWRFLAGHIVADGAIDTARLAQTRITGPLYGEGLADALDVGAL